MTCRKWCTEGPSSIRQNLPKYPWLNWTWNTKTKLPKSLHLLYLSMTVSCIIIKKDRPWNKPITFVKQWFFDVNFLHHSCLCWVTNRSVFPNNPYIFSFPFSANAALWPTTKFVINRGFAHWRINHSEKFPLLIKLPSVSSWRRQIWYGCQLSSSYVILINVLPEIPRPFIRQHTPLELRCSMFWTKAIFSLILAKLGLTEFKYSDLKTWILKF